MAIVVPASLAPDTLPRIRGVFLVRPWRGLWVAAKWPSKRGPPKTWRQYWTVQQFAYAGKMAANPEPISYETARFVTQDSHWLPRDVLTMVAYGKFYEVYLPDGTLAQQADHGPPAEQSNTRPNVLQWQFNAAQGVLAQAASTSAFAFKGVAFIPEVTMSLSAVTAVFAPVNGASYRATLAALNGSNQITAVTNGPIRVLSGTTKKPYEFLVSANLVAGTRYAVMIGRIDGASNYVMPLVSVANSNWLFPCTDLGFARLAQLLPSVGQTVEVGAGPFSCSMLLDY